jgi:hypothetical protein
MIYNSISTKSGSSSVKYYTDRIKNYLQASDI